MDGQSTPSNLVHHPGSGTGPCQPGSRNKRLRPCICFKRSGARLEAPKAPRGERSGDCFQNFNFHKGALQKTLQTRAQKPNFLLCKILVRTTTLLYITYERHYRIDLQTRAQKPNFLLCTILVPSNCLHYYYLSMA